MSEPTTEKFTRFGFDNEFFEITQASNPARIPVVKAATSATPSVALAEKRAPRTVKEALDVGYAEGFNAAQTQGAETLATELNNLRASNTAAIRTLEQAATDAAEELTRLSMTFLRASLHRFLGHAATHYPDQLLENHLKDMVSHLGVHENLILRIAPQARTFHEKLGLTHANIQGLPFFIKEDSSLAPTDCVAEWRRGGVEAKLSEHLERLDALLAGAGAILADLPDPTQPATATPPASAAPQTPYAPPLSPQARQLLNEDDDLVDALK